jgi:hypothetical protein
MVMKRGKVVFLLKEMMISMRRTVVNRLRVMTAEDVLISW